MLGTREIHKRRVAVLYTHALYGQGIAQLLQANSQLQVTCIKAGLTDAAERLKQLRPHAIVIEGCDEGMVPWDTVRDLPPAVFIGVHFDDNLMDIYRSRQVVAARPENLVKAIHRGLKRRAKQSPRQG